VIESFLQDLEALEDTRQGPQDPAECSLIRLQGTGLVGLRCNAGVVRQRLVVASHQALDAMSAGPVADKTRIWARSESVDTE